MTHQEHSGEGKKSTIVVEDGGLEFVTPGGRPLARLGLIDGQACLSLLGPAGGVNVSLRASVEGGVVTVYQTARDAGLACLRADADGALVGVADEHGTTTAVLRGSPAGELSLFDAKGQVGAGMYLSEHGGSILLFGRSGRPRLQADVYEDYGRLAVFNAGGAPVFVVPLQSAPGYRQGRPSPEETAPREL